MRRVSVFLRRYLPMILAVLVLLAVGVVAWIFSAPIAQWLRPARPAEAVAFLQEHLLAIGIVSGCLLILALMIWLPKWQASRIQDVKDRLTIENAARQTLAQMVGGAVLIIGLFFTWANLKTTQDSATKNQEIAREGQITDRFTKAIAQLGDEKIAVRLGGIYALERIAKDSEKDHWPIMEVLTSYVRERSLWVPKGAQPLKSNQSPQEATMLQGQGSLLVIPPPPRPELTADIQAILTVLRRRSHAYEKGDEQFLNLAGTDLRGADLTHAQLRGANLIGAQLQGASLSGAQLQGAELVHAQLQGADLTAARLERAWLSDAQLQEASLLHAQLQGALLADAQLQGAYLHRAQLQDAFLDKAQLQGAHLVDTQLERASFVRTNLKGAHFLTAKQFGAVKTLYDAHLDPPLLEYIRQYYPQLLDSPQEQIPEQIREQIKERTRQYHRRYLEKP